MYQELLLNSSTIERGDGIYTAKVDVTTGGLIVKSAASSEIIGQVGIDQTDPGTTNKVSIGTDGTVTLGAGEAHACEVGTNGIIVGVELTRPANTTPYIVNGTVSNSTTAPTVLTFTNIARANAKSGYIVKARIVTDQKTNISQYRLHLFHTTPTAINDNTAYSLLYANKSYAVGYIDFVEMTTEDVATSDAAFSLWTGQLHFVSAAASRTLYGLLETKTAGTPASGQKYYIELSADNN